VLFFLLS